MEIIHQATTIKTVLPVEAGASLIAAAFLRSGDITNENGIIVISGTARIELTPEQVAAMVTLPEGLTAANIGAGTFARTDTGWEVVVTVNT